jgi:hypothetical protein
LEEIGVPAELLHVELARKEAVVGKGQAQGALGKGPGLAAQFGRGTTRRGRQSLQKRELLADCGEFFEDGFELLIW